MHALTDTKLLGFIVRNILPDTPFLYRARFALLDLPPDIFDDRGGGVIEYLGCGTSSFICTLALYHPSHRVCDNDGGGEGASGIYIYIIGL